MVTKAAAATNEKASSTYVTSMTRRTLPHSNENKPIHLQAANDVENTHKARHQQAAYRPSLFLLRAACAVARRDGEPLCGAEMDAVPRKPVTSSGG
jgi:hypothetical protein